LRAAGRISPPASKPLLYSLERLAGVARMHRLLWPLFLVLALGVSAAVSGAAGASSQARVAAWAASPHAADADPDQPLSNLEQQTVRQRVRLSTGGTSLRIRFSNEHGSTPLTIGAATVALAQDAQTVKAASLKPLTFDGRTSVTIPPGAPVLSDVVDLSVPAGAEISVSLYFPERVTTPTLHGLALKTAVVTARGDFTRDTQVQAQATSESSMLITSVLIPARPKQRVVVAFGDSITDGDGSTVDADANWPSALVRRIGKRKGGVPIALVNAGIAGNRLLADGLNIKALGPSALARFDRDVLAIPGATHVVLLEGVNDIGFPGATLGGQPLADTHETRTDADLIGAYRELIARSHLRGLKIIGATLTPFEGVDLPGYYSDAKEATRQRVNTWIRTGGAFDGVIDFDAILRDAQHPSRMQARYASPDHLHPNDAGYQAMADAIDLSLFE
jgi:lysophospholipase L1-like esterase